MLALARTLPTGEKLRRRRRSMRRRETLELHSSSWAYGPMSRVFGLLLWNPMYGTGPAFFSLVFLFEFHLLFFVPLKKNLLIFVFSGKAS